MILRDYIDEFKTLIRQNYDESSMDDRLIIRWIDSQRNTWLNKHLNNNNPLPLSSIQTLKSVELSNAPNSYNSMNNELSNYLMTSVEIPNILEHKNEPLIKSCRVAELEGREVTIKPKEECKYAGLGRFNNNDLYGFLYNNRLYIKVPKNDFKAAMITHIDIDAVFETPMNLMNYKYPEGVSFNPDKDNYPIPPSIWEYMVGTMLEHKANVYEQIRRKPANDEREES